MRCLDIKSIIETIDGLPSVSRAEKMAIPMTITAFRGSIEAVWVKLDDII